MGVPLIEDLGFSIETISIEYEWKPPRCDLLEKKKKKGKSRSTNGGLFGGQSVKQNVRYEPKASTNVPNTRASNVGNVSKSVSSHVSSMSKNHPLKAIVPLSSSRRRPNVNKGGNIIVSNSYAALDDESEEKGSMMEELYQNTHGEKHSRKKETQRSRKHPIYRNGQRQEVQKEAVREDRAMDGQRDTVSLCTRVPASRHYHSLGGIYRGLSYLKDIYQWRKFIRSHVRALLHKFGA
nr:hypothetical protein [Tanacetum cinerariifolium]